MTYTPAQISAAEGGDVFVFDYAHADVVKATTFSAPVWTPYFAENVAVGENITPNVGNDGNSVAGSITFTVSLWHLDTFASSHVEWVGSGLTVEYSLDGTTWTALSVDSVIPLTNTDKFLDVKVSFAGGVLNDTSALTSLTVYVLAAGEISAASHARVLSFATDALTSSGLVTTTNRTISAADTTSTYTDPNGDALTGSAPVNIAAIEIYAAVGQLNETIFHGSAFSFSVNGTGAVAATGCTVYVNGVVSTSAPSLITGSIPYHFVIVPTTPVNEELTLGAGLTISNLALYTSAIDSTHAFDLYTSCVHGTPTIVINDSAAITVTESSPAVDVYAYAWSIVSGNTA